MLERNRRVAKAYARAPVITVNGSTDGFDGFRIGVAGFDNPLRDSNTSAAIQALGLGLKLKMDDVGNVLVKRISRYVIMAVWLFWLFLLLFANFFGYFLQGSSCISQKHHRRKCSKQRHPQIAQRSTQPRSTLQSL